MQYWLLLHGIFLRISNIEAIILVLTIFFVFIAEFINTAIEKLADLYTTEYNENIKIIKDIGAGSVTISAIASVIVGVIMFLPKIIKFI